jgi:ADP-heptose:LPS heptosyltransferase
MQHGVALAHWQDAIDDYDETAALVCALDGVLSVCTAVVHLAGALGRPVWVLAPSVTEWRYLDKGSTMPWYPSVHIIRQGRPGYWNAPMDAAIGLIAQRIASHGA